MPNVFANIHLLIFRHSARPAKKNPTPVKAQMVIVTTASLKVSTRPP